MEEYMLNRRHVVTLTTLLAVLLLAVPALAQQAKQYAVFPFSYNGPKKFSYFPKAFQASLTSDLEWIGKVGPAADNSIDGLTVPKSKADAINTLKGAGIDYFVTGDIAILDKDANITIHAFGANGEVWEKKGQMPINEIAPWLDEQSRMIQGDVFNRPGYGSSETERMKTESSATKGPLNSEIISATEDRYKADTLNPQFRYEGGTQSAGRWRSQTFRFYSNSMVVGDADGDGKNEVILLQRNNVHVMQFDNGKLTPLDSFPMAPNRKGLRLELVDIDRDGTQEIVVATYKEIYDSNRNVTNGDPYSHILSFKEGKLKPLLFNHRSYLGVLRLPPTYTPILVTQKKGRRHIFDGLIHEAFLKEGDIVRGQRITTPEFGNIFNTSYLPENFSFKYIVIDDFHRMKVYSQTMERLYSTNEDRYNTSGIGLEYADVSPGLANSKREGKIDNYNVPFRMLVASLTEKGKYELLANKDISVASQIFDRFTYFSQGEIHSMVWDGVGMSLAWKTRRIKGQVADLALADVNNDGKKQLVVLVNTFPGAITFENRKTVILAYDLNL